MMLASNHNFSEIKKESFNLLDNLCKIYPNFSLDNVNSVLPKLLNHTKIFKNIDFDEKKIYIVNMIKYIIENTDGPGDDNIWDPILISLVPSTVDMLIDVSNGKIKLDLNNKRNILSKLNCFKKKN